MKKLISMMAIVTQLISCQPAFAHHTEKEFDEDMMRLEVNIKRNHPDVVWVNGTRFKEVIL
jgi:hypothetical protein